MNYVVRFSLLVVLWTAPAFGQETTRPSRTPARAAAPDSGGNEADIVRQVHEAQREINEAQLKSQQRIREAQLEVQAIQRDLDQKSQRAQNLNQLYFNVHPPRLATIQFDNRLFNTFVKVYGLDFVEADPVLRAQLEIPATEGLVIVTVTPGGLADRAGIKEKDVIAKLNNAPVRSAAKTKELIAKPGNKSVGFDLYRKGKREHLTLTIPPPIIPPASLWVGIPVAPVDATLRSHLTALPADAGLIATDVIADSPGAKAGIVKTDVLFKVNDQLIGTQQAFLDQILKSEGKELKVELLRAGKPLTLAVTPAPRPTIDGRVIESTDQSMNENRDQVLKELRAYFPIGSTRVYNATRSKIQDTSPAPTTTTQEEIRILNKELEELKRAVAELKKAK